MNSEDIFHKAHAIVLDGSKQASILVLAMIAGRGIWSSNFSYAIPNIYFFIFSFLSVICCVFTHLVYGYELSLHLNRNSNQGRGKNWLFLATFFLILQIGSLFISIYYFIFENI